MELDCQHCGACCADVADVDRNCYIFVEPITARNIQTIDPTLIVTPTNKHIVFHNYAALALSPCKSQCAALIGTPGKSVSCKIYHNRPIICRGFSKGSEECYTARQMLGFPNPGE